jgi:DNA-directed RNA polymerase subunit RPC12/RpoP
VRIPLGAKDYYFELKAVYAGKIACAACNSKTLVPAAVSLSRSAPKSFTGISVCAACARKLALELLDAADRSDAT